MTRIAFDSRAGLVTGTVTDDPATGETLYDVRAPRVHGVIAITPGPLYAAEDLDPWTTTVQAYPGRSIPGYYTWERRADPLTVNGVPLCGPATVDTREMSARPLRWVHARRLLPGGGSNSEVPDATRRRYASVLDALVLHWTTRPDTAVVRITAARAMARSYVQSRRAEAARVRAEAVRMLAKAEAADQQADHAAALLTLTASEQGPA